MIVSTHTNTHAHKYMYTHMYVTHEYMHMNIYKHLAFLIKSFHTLMCIDTHTCINIIYIHT